MRVKRVTKRLKAEETIEINAKYSCENCVNVCEEKFCDMRVCTKYGIIYWLGRADHCKNYTEKI